MTYHFTKKILGSRISLTYKRLMKILRRGKITRKSYEVSKIGPQFYTSTLYTIMHSTWYILATPMIVAYQARGSVSSSAGLGTEWVRSSRDGTDVVCQWPRSWNVDTGSRRYTSCCTRRRQVRWTFDPTSSFYVTARPGRRPARHPSLESWAFLPAGRRRPPTSPSADTPPPSTGSLSSSNHLSSLCLSLLCSAIY